MNTRKKIKQKYNKKTSEINGGEQTHKFGKIQILHTEINLNNKDINVFKGFKHNITNNKKKQIETQSMQKQP